MRSAGAATALLCDDVARSSRLFTDHLGFIPTVELDWYVDLIHPDHPDHHVAFVQRDHDSLPDAVRGDGRHELYLALVVDDVPAEVARLDAAGVPIVVPVHDKPWGQRRAFVGGQDGPLIELLQPIDPDPDWQDREG